MARPFSYPEVAALEVGQTVRVPEHAATVRNRVAAYATRNNKAFTVRGERGSFYADVTRLPVTDAELPGAQ